MDSKIGLLSATDSLDEAIRLALQQELSLVAASPVPARIASLFSEQDISQDLSAKTEGSGDNVVHLQFPRTTTSSTVYQRPPLSAIAKN